MFEPTRRGVQVSAPEIANVTGRTQAAGFVLPLARSAHYINRHPRWAGELLPSGLPSFPGEEP